MIEEIWKDIKDYEGYYQVSSKGRVRSLDRIISRLNGRDFLKKGKLLSPDNCKGYVQVSLFKDGDRKRFKIHRIVAMSFLYNKRNLPQVNHIDGNKLNNRVENLEWCTAKENVNHAFDLNLRQRGESHCNSKLTEKQVLEIRDIKGKTQKEIAHIYRVSIHTISSIVRKKRWRHI